MVPWANIPRNRAAAASVSCSTEADRVIATVARMPVTGSRATNAASSPETVATYSSTLEPPNTRWVWQSTNPGATTASGCVDHRCTAGIDPLGDLLGGADIDDPFASDGDDSAGNHAQRIIPQRNAGDQL